MHSRSQVFRLTLATSMVVVPIATGTARAQFIVSDPTNLVQNAATALQTYDMLQNTYTQIDRMKDQITNQLQTLKNLDPRSFSDLRRLIDDGRMSYDMLRRDIDSIGYNVNDVNRNFDRLFPKTQAKWRSVRHSDFDGYYDRWNGEITASSLAAARAQSSISTLDRNNEAIIKILDASNASSTGEVRQLQLVNQQLALIHAGISSLVQNLATTGRVLSDWAAASVGEKMINREAATRRLENYTSRGRPSRRLQRLP